MSLQADYLKEREGVDSIEHDHGFITFKMFDRECFIIDIYVSPAFRKSHLASEMAKEVEALAKLKGIKIVTGSVDTRLDSATTSTKVLLAYGFKISGTDGPVIRFYKETA